MKIALCQTQDMNILIFFYLKFCLKTKKAHVKRSLYIYFVYILRLKNLKLKESICLESMLARADKNTQKIACFFRFNNRFDFWSEKIAAIMNDKV